MTTRTIRTSADIKGMVQPGKQVRFVRFQSGVLWYATDCGFEFPVSADETGEANYLASDKAMLFLRFIRKQVKEIEASLAQSEQAFEPQLRHGLPLC